MPSNRAQVGRTSLRTGLSVDVRVHSVSGSAVCPATAPRLMRIIIRQNGRITDESRYIDRMKGSPERDHLLAVGSRVHTTDDSHTTGLIVEDFGALAGAEVVVDDKLTVRGRRWAVALDDGNLIFANSDELELIDPT